MFCLKNADLAWEEISREQIVSDEWIEFRKSVFRYPDGRVFEPYYTYSRKDYVVIVATDEEGRFLCVRQYRQGIMDVTTEFTAGGIEVKDKDGKVMTSDSDSDMTGSVVKPGVRRTDHPSVEWALAAAKRELAEETGYESDEWKHLLTIPSNATMADNWAYLFTAKNCRKVTEQSLDETEYLGVELLSADDIEKLIAGGGFQQAIHCLAWELAKKM
ncbi:MAG: NUDIX hydrolase [Lachnospiraceae bacterium]|nr:NUDIX hydrolase [Lachnospiraceae bacterium]